MQPRGLFSTENGGKFTLMVEKSLLGAMFSFTHFISLVTDFQNECVSFLGVDTDSKIRDDTCCHRC
jgi:hypothetical protein